MNKGFEKVIIIKHWIPICPWCEKVLYEPKEFYTHTCPGKARDLGVAEIIDGKIRDIFKELPEGDKNESNRN